MKNAFHAAAILGLALGGAYLLWPGKALGLDDFGPGRPAASEIEFFDEPIIVLRREADISRAEKDRLAGLATKAGADRFCPEAFPYSVLFPNGMIQKASDAGFLLVRCSPTHAFHPWLAVPVEDGARPFLASSAELEAYFSARYPDFTVMVNHHFLKLERL